MSATTPQWNQLFQYEDGHIEQTDERGTPVLTSIPSRKRPKRATDHGHDKKQP
jgi:hypothetical protein